MDVFVRDVQMAYAHFLIDRFKVHDETADKTVPYRQRYREHMDWHTNCCLVTFFVLFLVAFFMGIFAVWRLFAFALQAF
jgi:uncharacterized membrane protein